MDILNTVQHPYDSSSVLNWVLWRWQEDPYAHLLLITKRGEAVSLNNKIRVKLSNARATLKHNGTAMRQFGMESTIIDWTLLDGTTLEALCLSRVVMARHRFTDLLIAEGGM